jgi:hypothetical protein
MHMHTADIIRERAVSTLLSVNQNPRAPKIARDRAYDQIMRLAAIHERAHRATPDA